jgi:hypothetical protein
MLNNAVSSDIWATTPGGYCNAYKVGSEVRYQNSFDQSLITGFNPGTPFYDWQEGDAGSNNVCQAKGSTWGFKVSGASNNNCTPNIVCGMHHFHRLGGDIRPWNGATPGTALTFSYDTKPQTVTLAGGGAAGYFCILLREVDTPHHIELCFKQWQQGSGFPGTDLVCADTAPAGYNVDTAWTTFNANQAWGTQRAGSVNTFSSVPNNAFQSASISARNLLNVINRVNSPTPQPSGCNRGVSVDVRNYQLVGFENGVEGGGFSLIGASVANEQLSTTSDALFTNDRMNADQAIYSSSNTYRLIMQGDGNLVVYRTADNFPIWSSKTFHEDAYLRMQDDGNLVIYRPNDTALGSSHTNGFPGSHIVLQDDGNLVIYYGNQAKWASAQHPEGLTL